ncbi:MAG: antibiotic biosynthesis monooxygenase [Aliishimia sp.]
MTEVDQIRAMTGCVTFIPFKDASNPHILGVFHEWDSADDFAGYTASRAFARNGQKLRPIMLSAPVSRRFDAYKIDG